MQDSMTSSGDMVQYNGNVDQPGMVAGCNMNESDDMTWVPDKA